MRVLLDECLPRRLASLIVRHDVMTVPEAGLAGQSNGELLRSAGAEFDAFVTIDQNLPAQQSVQSFDIAVIVLAAPSNRLDDVAPLAPRIVAALDGAQPGRVYRIAR